MHYSGQSFKDPLSLILAALVALALLGAWQYVKDSPGIDYYVTWVASDAVNSDTPHNIYEPPSRYILAVEYRNLADATDNAPRQKLAAGHLKDLQMTATPFLYWVTGLLSSGHYEQDLTVWQALSLLFVTASILLVCRLTGYSPATSLALLLPVLVWFLPFFSNLRVANVNGMQLALLSLALWLMSRPASQRTVFLGGVVIGLLVMYKPNLAPVALVFCGGWLARRQYSQLGIAVSGTLTGAIAAVLVSSAWLGSATAWLDWFRYIREFVDGGPGETGGNYAIITRVFANISPAGQLGMAVFLCLVCLAVYAWGRRNTGAGKVPAASGERLFIENTLLVSMACIIPVLTSTLVWLHYYLLAVPLFIVVLRPWQEPGPMRIMPFLMLRLLPTVALVFLLETALGDIIGAEGRSYRMLATTTSALCLFAAGLWQLGHGIRDGAPE